MQGEIQASFEKLGIHTGGILAHRPVGGGSINRCYEVQTGDEHFFVKVNAHREFPGMFEAEAAGLNLLNAHSSFRIPRVVGHTVVVESQFLIMEFLENGRETRDFWADFGRRLAQMHAKTSSGFGLDHDNYIGSLPQRNDRTDAWSEFFVSHRLEPQLRMAGSWFDASDRAAFEWLFQRLSEFFPEEVPSLLHGDLWSGNYLCGLGGEPVLIDPAVYYGHRLMDLGMSLLFGGFGSEMYEAYHDMQPLPTNWRDGAEVANLYPLLVHVNLFGGSYVSQVRQILRRYT